MKQELAIRLEPPSLDTTGHQSTMCYFKFVYRKDEEPRSISSTDFNWSKETGARPELADAVLVVWIRNNGHSTVEFEYRPCYSTINLAQSERMVKTFRKLNRDLMKMDETYGGSDDAGEQILRICAALGATCSLERVNGTWIVRSMPETRWRVADIMKDARAKMKEPA